MRLDLPAGTAVRFEPGEIKTVQLVELAGERQVYGGSGLVMGPLDEKETKKRSLERLEQWSKGEFLIGKKVRDHHKDTKDTKKKSKK